MPPLNLHLAPQSIAKAWMLCLILAHLQAMAQPCDPTLPPAGLTSAYTPGSGVLLEWNAVPGSEAARIHAATPAGPTITRTIVGFEPDAFFVPEAFLGAGLYHWTVRIACSSTPPYAPSPLASPDTFMVSGTSVCPASVTDIDGNTYGVVPIGTQCWTTENLRVSRYSNGDTIPLILVDSIWYTTHHGAACYYENDLAYQAIYGLLYNYYAAVDSRGVCPTGWHVPDLAEFDQLLDYLGGYAMAGGALKSTSSAISGGLWAFPNAGATNSSGFTGLPGGFRWPGGNYGYVRDYGVWWLSEPLSGFYGHGMELQSGGTNSGTWPYADESGLSLRCVRD